MTHRKRLLKCYGPCGCCYTMEPLRTRERRASRNETTDQLTEYDSAEDRAMKRLAALEDANPDWRTDEQKTR